MVKGIGIRSFYYNLRLLGSHFVFAFKRSGSWDEK